MRRIFIVVIALLLALSVISCGRVSQRQVEKMIEDAVEEALEEQAEQDDKDKDKEDEKNEEEDEKEEDEKDEAEGKDEGNGGSTLYSYDYVGEKIPDGFPSEHVPLYESRDATVVAAIKTTAGGAVSFTIGIGTNDDIEDVIDDVYESLKKMYKEEEVQKISTGDSAMFVVVPDKDWSFTITVGDGTEEDFKTLIGYSVISN